MARVISGRGRHRVLQTKVSDMLVLNGDGHRVKIFVLDVNVLLVFFLFGLISLFHLGFSFTGISIIVFPEGVAGRVNPDAPDFAGPLT